MISKITTRLLSGKQVAVVGLRRVNLFSGKDIGVTKQVIDNIRTVSVSSQAEALTIQDFNLLIQRQRYDIIVMYNVEAGIHYTEYCHTIEAIDKFSRRYDTQFFITTQSLEFIKAAHGYFMACANYDFAYHRIDWLKKSNRYDAKIYDQETLEAAKNMNFEVR